MKIVDNNTKFPMSLSPTQEFGCSHASLFPQDTHSAMSTETDINQILREINKWVSLSFMFGNVLVSSGTEESSLQESESLNPFLVSTPL